MLKVRIIPILTFNGLGLVKTKKFANPRMVGNPVQAARVYNSRGVDELAFIDIMASRQKRNINLNLVKDVIRECFMPVTIGGGIKNIEDINNLLRVGADKVVLKTQALVNTSFVTEAVKFFGSQCISVAADVIMKDGVYRIHNDMGLDVDAGQFLAQMQDLGAGEIILTSVEYDGMMGGFDIALTRSMQQVTQLPIIAVGGAGTPEHFCNLLEETNVEAIGAASIYHFTQFTPLDVKKSISRIGVPVRMTH